MRTLACSLVACIFFALLVLSQAGPLSSEMRSANAVWYGATSARDAQVSTQRRPLSPRKEVQGGSSSLGWPLRLESLRLKGLERFELYSDASSTRTSFSDGEESSVPKSIKGIVWQSKESTPPLGRTEFAKVLREPEMDPASRWPASKWRISKLQGYKPYP
ncbi:hypothetical protein CBOM_00212 [Ceraceosorus bombacis]|uniref:RxLR-like protein n=1 Tax=Ceraceosorus bombacis TaxID=401625 RepID=A0A0P1BAS7_9BASI|nr:hypothetical protein CBOM_00212 [Ceraceosorus bombacis]